MENASTILSCPVCGQPLERDGSSLRCAGNHCYDIARAGYVNLLLSNQSAGHRHGDDRKMLDARTAFLEKGFYAPVSDAINDLAAAHIESIGSGIIADCGCGDGWYTYRLLDRMAGCGARPRTLCVDISRDALRLAARRNTPGRGYDVTCAVASAYRLPLAAASCGLLMSVFAPIAAEEFARVLADDGLLLTAVPLERHLFGLKSAVYDTPYENPHEDGELPGFTLSERRSLEYDITLTGEEARQLFMMTPYYYKTSREDQQKLETVDELKTEVAIEVRIYSKTKQCRTK